MSPVHVAPVPSIRVMLIEQVIRTRLVDQAVGIVVPASARCEMKLGPIRLLVNVSGVRDVAALSDGVQAAGAG